MISGLSASGYEEELERERPTVPLSSSLLVVVSYR